MSEERTVFGNYRVGQPAEKPAADPDATAREWFDRLPPAVGHLVSRPTQKRLIASFVNGFQSVLGWAIQSSPKATAKSLLASSDLAKSVT